MSKHKDKSKKDGSKKTKSQSEAPQEKDALQSPAAKVDAAPKKEKKRKRDERAEDGVAEPPKKAKKSIDVPALEDDATVESKQKKKKDKKSKKRKAADAEPAEPAVEIEDDIEDKTMEQDFIKFDDTSVEKSAQPTVSNGTISRTGSKKSKKKDKKARKAEESEVKDEPVPEAKGAAEVTSEEKPAEGVDDASSGKKERFVVFVGNLPYTATKEEILRHFEKIHPKEARIMTDKATGKPKGFAFVEFDRFDHMQTCLKKYHHSEFQDGKQGRKINVELSAGGGGNTEARRFKIQTKNEKLANERQRDHEKRDELEAKKRERQAKKDARQRKGKEDVGSADTAPSEQPSGDNGGIHPSRLALMQGPASSGRPNKRMRY